ncbi:hypothetical protein [Sporomusa malonica]|uniref:Uncharacterized protein n=1 Tax=Sporomusa malonica TaxID=112901 RepID=A0A1W2DV27_9FIRM|nr:hypothetical protein [Sporomusa malonica]SMD00912.1 hypothetical protein SAMN04488500_11854 [Sporomusa malonica]
MTTYRVIIDGQEKREHIVASNYADAYFDVASTMPLTYQTDVKLVPVEEGDGIHSVHQHLHDIPGVKQNQNVYDSLSE